MSNLDLRFFFCEVNEPIKVFVLKKIVLLNKKINNIIETNETKLKMRELKYIFTFISCL